MKGPSVLRCAAIVQLVIGMVVCERGVASDDRGSAQVASRVEASVASGSASHGVTVLMTSTLDTTQPNVPPISEVKGAATVASAPGGSSSATVAANGAFSPAGPVCPEPLWVPQDRSTHLPLTGDLSIKNLSKSVTAEVITDAKVRVRVGDSVVSKVSLDPGHPTRVTFESDERDWTETGVLLPVQLSIREPSEWPSSCRLLNFIVIIALSKVHFAISNAPAGLICEKPCEVENPRKSRAIWGEKAGLEISLKQESGETSLPGAVTISLDGDEVTGRPAYSMPGHTPLSNLHFNLVPKWRFITVSPSPLAVRLDIGVGTDPLTGATLQGVNIPILMESVPPWWARLPVWLVAALIWALVSGSPLVRKADAPKETKWRLLGALVSAALVFSVVEAAASSLPKAFEDVPYTLWGSFLLGFGCALAGVTLVMKYLEKIVKEALGIKDEVKPATPDPKTASQASGGQAGAPR